MKNIAHPNNCGWSEIVRRIRRVIAADLRAEIKVAKFQSEIRDELSRYYYGDASDEPVAKKSKCVSATFCPTDLKCVGVLTRSKTKTRDVANRIQKSPSTPKVEVPSSCEFRPFKPLNVGYESTIVELVDDAKKKTNSELSMLRVCEVLACVNFSCTLRIAGISKRYPALTMTQPYSTFKKKYFTCSCGVSSAPAIINEFSDEDGDDEVAAVSHPRHYVKTLSRICLEKVAVKFIAGRSSNKDLRELITMPDICEKVRLAMVYANVIEQQYEAAYIQKISPFYEYRLEVGETLLLKQSCTTAEFRRLVYYILKVKN